MTSIAAVAPRDGKGGGGGGDGPPGPPPGGAGAILPQIWRDPTGPSGIHLGVITQRRPAARDIPQRGAKLMHHTERDGKTHFPMAGAYVLVVVVHSLAVVAHSQDEPISVGPFDYNRSCTFTIA